MAQPPESRWEMEKVLGHVEHVLGHVLGRVLGHVGHVAVQVLEPKDYIPQKC